MNNEEFNKIWQRLDSRIEVINDRTKNHTIYIKELKKEIKELQKLLKNEPAN